MTEAQTFLEYLMTLEGDKLPAEIIKRDSDLIEVNVYMQLVTKCIGQSRVRASAQGSGHYTMHYLSFYFQPSA